MELKINETDLKELIDKEYLSSALATKIYESKKDKNWNDEFDREFLKALKITVKEIIDEWLKEYEEESNIKQIIHNEISSLTRAEIIKVLMKDK